MSSENVELAQRLYEAWARQEIPGPRGLLDPDVEYVNPDGATEPRTPSRCGGLHCSNSQGLREG
jgi:ketosteroid isomerase-like protein